MNSVRTKFEHVDFDKTTNRLIRRYYTDASKQTLFSTINTDYGWEGLTKGELYHPNSKIKSTFTLNKNDEYQGRVNIYREDGTLLNTCTHVNGRKHGYEICYYPNGNNVHTSIQYSYDVQDGPYTIMYPTGKIKEKGQFSRGHPVNRFVIRYDNLKNSIMIECEFSEKGILKNEYKVFDEKYEDIPTRIYYYNDKGDCINKIELDHFKMSDECQTIHDKILTIHEGNKYEANIGDLKSMDLYSCDKFDVSGRHRDPEEACGSLLIKSSPSSGYNYSSLYNYQSILAQNRNNEYEEGLCKAIEESKVSVDTKNISTATARSMLEGYKREKVALYEKEKAENHMAQLKKCCLEFYTIETTVM